MSNLEDLNGARVGLVKRAAERLHELEASGVKPLEILSGLAGATFIRDDCGGDLDIACAAFAIVHSPKNYVER